MQTLHRSRDRLVGERTALINQLRAILLERWDAAPQGKRKLEQFLAVLMDEQGGAGMSPRMVLLIADARTQWAELDRRIAAFDAELLLGKRERRRPPTGDIPGFGAIVASALVAAVGRAESFERGRDLGLARLGPLAVHHRRQIEAARDQQARQQIPAPTADPRGARGVAPCRRARHSTWLVGPRGDQPRPSQYRCCGVRQQAGSNCLGDLRRGETFAARGLKPPEA